MRDVICTVYNQYGINMWNLQRTWKNQFEKKKRNPDKNTGKELKQFRRLPRS